MSKVCDLVGHKPHIANGVDLGEPWTNATGHVRRDLSCYCERCSEYFKLAEVNDVFLPMVRNDG